MRVVDRHGVEVPDADNSVMTSVTGAGTFAGADNGKEDDAEGYKSPRHDAFNGQVLAIVESATHPGPITVKVSSAGLLPATTTLYAQNPGRPGVTAVAPVYVRTLQGTSASLPSRVQLINGDGTTRRPRCVVRARTRRRRASRVYTVTRHASAGRGSRPGPSSPSPASPRCSSAHALVPVGMTPTAAGGDHGRLHRRRDPDAARALAADPRRRASPSPASSRCHGRVTRIAVPARLLVTVTRHVTTGQNLALAAGPEQPTADASFSGGVFTGDGSDFGTSTTVPAAMLDGNTTSGGWSDRSSKGPTQTLNEVTNARAGDWVSVSWPERPDVRGAAAVLHRGRRRPAAGHRAGVLLERAGLGARPRSARAVRRRHRTSRRRSRSSR